MATKHVPSTRSLKASNGGLELLPPDGTVSLSTSGTPADDHEDHSSHHGNPITERNTVVGIPRKSSSSSLTPSTSCNTQTTPLYPSSNGGRSPTVGVGSQTERLSDLALNSSEGEPSGCEGAGQQGDMGAEVQSSEEEILSEAGVELQVVGEAKGGGAPLELVTQFLSCLMEGEHEAARILCEKILQMEPSNATVQEFRPLILERLRLDAELPSESSSEEESSEGSINFVSSGESDSEEDENSGNQQPTSMTRTSHKHCTASHTHV